MGYKTEKKIPSIILSVFIVLLMLIEIGIPIICSAILEGVGNFIQLDYPAPQDYKTYGYKIFSTVASIESLKKVTDYFDNKDNM